MAEPLAEPPALVTPALSTSDGGSNHPEDLEEDESSYSSTSGSWTEDEYSSTDDDLHISGESGDYDATSTAGAALPPPVAGSGGSDGSAAAHNHDHARKDFSTDRECPEGPECPWNAEDYDEKTIIKLQSVVRRWRAKRSFSQLVLLALHHPSQAQFRKRNEVWRELLTTERHYVTSLTFLEQYWLIPLQREIDEVNKYNEHKGALHKKRKPMIDADGLKLLFGSLVPMRDFHIELLKDMEAAARRWPAWNGLGELMVQRFPFLRLYIDYVQKFDEKTRYVIDLAKGKGDRAKRFRKFEDAIIQKREVSAGMDLRAFLIMPVQRIPRYELLIRELIKLTPEDHVDLANLTKAADLVHTVATQINERQSDPEFQAAMQAVLERSAGMKDNLMSNMTMRFGGKKERTAITGPFTMTRSTKDLLMAAAQDGGNSEVADRKLREKTAARRPAVSMDAGAPAGAADPKLKKKRRGHGGDGGDVTQSLDRSERRRRRSSRHGDGKSSERDGKSSERRRRKKRSGESTDATATADGEEE